MSGSELATQLAELHRAAKGIGVILFGVKYDREIERSGYTVPEIVRLSSVSPSYVSEVYKGRRLARYVAVTRMPSSSG